MFLMCWIERRCRFKGDMIRKMWLSLDSIVAERGDMMHLKAFMLYAAFKVIHYKDNQVN